MLVRRVTQKSQVLPPAQSKASWIRLQGTFPLEAWVSPRVDIFLIPQDREISWQCGCASPQDEEHPSTGHKKYCHLF